MTADGPDDRDPTEGVDPRIVTGSIYRPPDVAHRRLLVMRRWPRGVAKSRVDEWLPDLGPSVDLLTGYREGTVEWDAFETAYLDQVEAQPELLERTAAIAADGGVLLLCGSHWPCHRLPLARLLTERLEDV